MRSKVSGSAAMDERAMPQYMSKSPAGTGYLFRRGVPADVRPAIGKREFKFVLGGDFRSASQRCRELAVETDRLIADARASAAPQAVVSGEVAPPIAQSPPPLSVIQEVTPDLVARLQSTVIAQVLSVDKAERHRARVAINPVEKLEQIERVRAWASLAKFGDEGAVRGWSSMLAGTLKRNGFCLAPELLDSPQERELLIEYASAYRDGLDLLKAEYSGQPTPARPPAAGLLMRAEVVSASSMRLSDAVGEFLKHLHPEKRAMNEKHGFILPAFLDVVGDMPISELRQSHVKDFLLTVQKLPPRWSDLRRKTGQNIRELASQAWDTTLALKTYEDTYIASVRTFLDRAVSDWQDIGFPTTLSVSVPYVGTRKGALHKQRAIRPGEIRQMFFNERSEKFTKDPSQVHKFWLLAIELYTGARVREICQVNPQHDWGCEGGHWWLRFTNENGERPDPDVIKSIKTKRPRTIPMHSELVRLGLPDYLKTLKQGGARRLFPSWAPRDGNAGEAPAKWVTNFLHAIGLHGAANEQGNALRGSHAFRHTLLTYGRKAGANLRSISGHVESSGNRVADGYEDDTVLSTLPDMAVLLAKLDYGVTLPVPVPVLKVPVARAKRQAGQSPRFEAGR
jgi:integrase